MVSKREVIFTIYSHVHFKQTPLFSGRKCYLLADCYSVAKNNSLVSRRSSASIWAWWGALLLWVQITAARRRDFFMMWYKKARKCVSLTHNKQACTTWWSLFFMCEKQGTRSSKVLDLDILYTAASKHAQWSLVTFFLCVNNRLEGSRSRPYIYTTRG